MQSNNWKKNVKYRTNEIKSDFLFLKKKSVSLLLKWHLNDYKIFFGLNFIFLN